MTVLGHFSHFPTVKGSLRVAWGVRRRLLSGHILAHSLENIYLGARLAAGRPAFTRIYLARAHLTIYEKILLVVPDQISSGDGEAAADYKPRHRAYPRQAVAGQSPQKQGCTRRGGGVVVHSLWILKFSNFDIDTFDKHIITTLYFSGDP